MPNLHSAVKRARLAKKARQVNRQVRAQISTLRRRSMETAAAKEPAPAQAAFRRYCSLLDKAAKRGVIKKNTAIRRKRRAAARLAAMGPAG